MAIIFSRAIGPVPIPCVLSEKPESKLSITRIPLESGAVATDHAHSEPFRLTLDVAADNLAVTYQNLVQFQRKRVPFTYVSGFDVHTNLLIESIESERSSQYAKAFRGTIVLSEIIIVGSATVNAQQQADQTNGASGKSTESQGGKNSPGGHNSRRASPPSSSRAAPSSTDRATSTVQRGEIRANTVEAPKRQSILSRLAN